jgi:hypothetical protein
MNTQMSLVGRGTQDRSIKIEKGMEKGKLGILGELSRLVSGMIASAQMVKSINCKMMAHTVSSSIKMAR